MRNLRECMNAIFPNGLTTEYVYCKKGHKLGDGRITGQHVQMGRLLVCQRCQGCWDFNYDGEWEGEKGWSVDTKAKGLLTGSEKCGSM